MNHQTFQNTFRRESFLSLRNLTQVRSTTRTVFAAAVLLSAGLNQAFGENPGYVGLYYKDTGVNVATVLGRTFPPFTVGVQALSPGWTHIIRLGDGGRILYYNQVTGLGASAYPDRVTGSMTTVDYFHFKAGWSSIVLANGYLLFYDKVTGEGVVGEMRYIASHDVFHQFPTIYQFATGWTHITSNGSAGASLFFYNAETGGGATGTWAYTYPSICVGFCPPSDVKFQQRVAYPEGSFDKNWTGIVRIYGSIMFYRAGDGFSVINVIDKNGRVIPRAYSSTYLSPGWTGFALVDNALFFYNMNTGDGAVAHVVESYEDVGQAAGTLFTDQVLPGAFPTGSTTVYGIDQ
jgi:hypothetical protein